MTAAARRRPSEPYYLTLSTGDVGKAAAFYGAVLDWSFADSNDGGTRHITNTEFPMGLRPTETSFGTTESGDVELWFTVRDFDDAVQRVQVAGGTVLSITSYDSGREARCEDDQGTGFSLGEPAPATTEANRVPRLRSLSAAHSRRRRGPIVNPRAADYRF